jgi:hypothetical protein
MTFGRMVRGQIVESWTHWDVGADTGGQWRTVAAHTRPPCGRVRR